MRTLTMFWCTLLVASGGCKGRGETITDADDVAGDADTDADADTDSDADADTDSDTDADTDTDAQCWVASPDGDCYDTTLCALPTVAGADSLAFLNRCTDVDASAFDNAARIPASTWVPGTPLPAVP